MVHNSCMQVGIAGLGLEWIRGPKLVFDADCKAWATTVGRMLADRARGYP